MFFSTQLISQDIYLDMSMSSNFNAPHTINGNFGDENFGTGQAFVDLNKDNNLDIVVSNQLGPNKIFINSGNSTFSEPSNFQNFSLADEYCKGTSIADFDNDGCDDIYLSCNGPDHLFKNINGTSLIDVTIQSGIENNFNSQSSAWAGINDGWLDFYVINYDTGLGKGNGSIASDPVTDVFFLSNGDGTFTNITSSLDNSQLLKPNLALTFVDYDNDGDQDLYVVTDKLKNNVLWRNDGEATLACGPVWCFKDVSISTQTNIPVFGMGIATGDVDNDGNYDFYFSSIGEQVLLLNQISQGSETFINATGITALNIASVGWGTLFLDYNNDAWIDAYVATHNDTVELSDTLFQNNKDGSFTNVNSTCGATNLIKSEGVAYGDVNNDGKLDIVLANYATNYQLFKNESDNNNNWIKIKLIGGNNINKNVIGSKITLTTNEGISQIRTVTSGSSRGAGNELTLHFGLGEASISSIEILWSSGIKQKVDIVLANQMLEINYADYNEIYINGFD